MAVFAADVIQMGGFPTGGKAAFIFHTHRMTYNALRVKLRPNLFERCVGAGVPLAAPGLVFKLVAGPARFRAAVFQAALQAKTPELLQ